MMNDTLCLRRKSADVPSLGRVSNNRVAPSKNLPNCIWSKKVNTSPRKSSDVEVKSWDNGKGILYDGLIFANTAGEITPGIDRLWPESIRIAGGFNHVSPLFSICSRNVLVRI